MTPPASGIIDREATVRGLAAARSRSAFLRWSAGALTLIAAYAWATGDFAIGDFTSEARLNNVRRFARELKPFPLQSRPWDWAIAWRWTADLMATRGWEAASTTLATSIAAIVLAGVTALPISLLTTRTLAAAEPYLQHVRPPSVAIRGLWLSLVWLTRALLIFMRAIPEYVWAFLLVTAVGPTLWAAVLALAIHNTGILGKLNAEVMENFEQETPGALRGLGAGRRQIGLIALLPSLLPRFVLFFFYRWETCVREATVLGMLGIVSLGFFIQDARARQQYDVMLLLILIGSGIVLVGDLVSAGAREAVRRSS